MRNWSCSVLGALVLLSLTLPGGCPNADPGMVDGIAVEDAPDDSSGNPDGANPDVVVDPEAGSDPDGGGDPAPSDPLAVYQDELSAADAWHLLRRANLGARPAEVDRAVERGLTATVSELLDTKSLPVSAKALADSYENDIRKRWLVYLIESPTPLLERIAMFWHDRFATSQRVAGFRERNLAIQHWSMLRRNALGNYAEFLSDLTLDPLMLLWLNAAESPKESPNENYTREFWELFTLGRDVLYTENDIREGARAFTGISLIYPQEEDPRPVFDIFEHDDSIKTIFPDRAEPAEYNYVSIIDVTLAQPEAAEYVARNLFVFLVHDHPDDEVIRDLADQFVESGFEIEPLVRRLLLSQAFFSAEARDNQISSPVEHIVSVARTLDMHIHSEDSQGFIMDRLVRDLAAAGQELLNPPGVEGWGEGQAWLQDQWVLSRVRALGRTMEYGPDRTDDLPYHLLPRISRWDQREVRRQIVEAIAAVFHLELTEDEIDIYIEVLDQNGWRAFHLLNADQQPRHVFEMIRLMAMDERVIGR